LLEKEAEEKQKELRKQEEERKQKEDAEKRKTQAGQGTPIGQPATDTTPTQDAGANEKPKTLMTGQTTSLEPSISTQSSFKGT
jgi:hypothetical protein